MTYIYGICMLDQQIVFLSFQCVLGVEIIIEVIFFKIYLMSSRNIHDLENFGWL